MNAMTVVILDLTENREGKMSMICKNPAGEEFTANSVDEILFSKGEFVRTTDGRTIEDLYYALRKRNFLQRIYDRIKVFFSV